MWNKILLILCSAAISALITFSITMGTVIRQVVAQGVTMEFMQQTQKMMRDEMIETQKAIRNEIAVSKAESIARDERLTVMQEKFLDQMNVLMAALRIEIQQKGRP